jgi:hypothetical protein
MTKAATYGFFLANLRRRMERPMKINIAYGSSGEAPTYRGELRLGACIKWQGEWRTKKQTAQDDAETEMRRRAANVSIHDHSAA